MKAVIMAGGKGTRLMPITADIPKPLVPVLNAPIIDYSLALLDRYKINEIAVTLQHLPEKIIEHLDASAYKDRLYYFMENSPLGTAGSVKNTGKFLDETFIVISGDALTDINIEKMLSFHRANKADITIAVKEVEDPSQFGVVCADSLGRVFGFQEKPKTEDCAGNTVSCGIYIIEPSVMEMVPANETYDFARGLFPEMLEKRMRLFAYKTEDYWCDVGNIGTYFSANTDALCGRFDASSVPQILAGGKFLERDNARVFTGGNLYLGDDVKLSGDIIIGANVTINSGANLSNCIIADRVTVPAFAEIQDCILTVSDNIGVNIDISEKSNISVIEKTADNIIPFTVNKDAAAQG